MNGIIYQADGANKPTYVKRQLKIKGGKRIKRQGHK